MIGLQFSVLRRRTPTFLFIGAHCDDIEIGCGGTVIELLRLYPRAKIHWVVLSSEGERAKEARLSVKKLFRGLLPPKLAVEAFRGSFFPSEAPLIKEYFEGMKQSVSPDVVFTHCRDELHQDHRVVGELTWNAFRDHMILEYEIPKYDGGLGSPSVFVPLDSRTVKAKVSLLMTAFRTQRSKRWFTPETFHGLMRLRGVECNAPSGYAEAFYCRKLILGQN